MLLQLIQRQVPIGGKAKFSLKNGREISGVLIELGRDHITLQSNGSIATVLIENIGAWEVLLEDKLEGSDKQTSEVEHNDNKAIPDIPLIDQPNKIDDKPVSSAEDAEPKILKKLFEIEARFEAQLQAAKLEQRPPNFFFPTEELKDSQNVDAATIWNRFRSKYEYAAKIKELGAQFGRIQPLVADLRTLTDWFPSSPTVKRHLAFLSSLLGDEKEAIRYYKDAALLSQEIYDWYNVAALALKDGQEDEQEKLACYSLEQFFNRISVIEEPNAWYIYVRLLKKFSNYPALRALCKTKAHDLSEDEGRLLFETGLYLLTTAEQDKTTRELLQKWLGGQPLHLLLPEAIGKLDSQPSEAYKQFLDGLSLVKKETKKLSFGEVKKQQQGHIYSYKPDRNFGFLRGIDGKEYFFHRSAILDDDLFDKVISLGRYDQIVVAFETAQGPKGPLAVGLSLYHNPGEVFELANKYANDGEYPKAIAQIKRLLNLNSEYPNAQELYEKWREYARISGVPRGSNPFARAKRAQLIERDLDKAANLFRIAIKQGDNIESAVKDLATLLVQQGKHQDGIQILLKNRNRIQDQKSVDNLLIVFYQNAGQHDQSIALLQKKLGKASTAAEKVQVLWQIAHRYLKQEDYSQAESCFKKVVTLQPDNRAAQRHVAICLFKQERYDEAEKILNRILDTSPDAQAATLLEAVIQVKATGQVAQIDEIIIETTLSNFSGEISKFTQFFLDRCDFQGVPPERVRKQSYNRVDVQKLEGLATQLGRRRPRDRAGYYLSAAKIVSILEEEDFNQFYKYLCWSFASRGDASVSEGKYLDTVRELYCEALAVYDNDRSQHKGEEDAVNALVRFLFSTLGQSHIPIKPEIPSIDETLEISLNRHPQRDRVFDAITYLVLRSRYAANHILNSLYTKSSLQAMALEYLKAKSISVSAPIKQLEDFVRLWNELRRKSFDEVRSVSSELRFLTKVELTTASIENAIERTKGLNHRLFFDLDQQRMAQFQKILEMALDLCKQFAFEEQERLCIQIASRCQDLLGEIEESPTKLSVEEIYTIIETIQKKVKDRLEELYRSSMPQLSLRLPVESYTADNNEQIEVQIVVANRMGCSPAEALELIVQEDEDLFILNSPDIKLDSSLRGGDQQILRVPIRVTEHALHSQTFSFPVYAQYRTRSEQIAQTSVENFSIRLYSEEEFEEIKNPYAAYAEGGVVGAPEMFYGREELIENTAKAIQESYTQSKCIVIFGQKRAGKSSILHHLKAKLAVNNDLLILDLGNIGSIFDENSPAPFLYQILWSILNKLIFAIEDKVEQGFSLLSLSFPDAKEFYEHPSPLVFFKEIFERYKRQASKVEVWRNVRAVLLIDEFSYIYAHIVNRRISESFMKNWKALLQENFFSAVLVGQDVMPKFKQRFPNEFGTSQDERVSYLKREDAIKLIGEPIRIGGQQGESRYRERAMERIVDLTAGSPFYIQIICNRLVEYMNRKRAKFVTEADVEQVKNELIRGVNTLGLDKFDNLINSGDASEDAISDEDALKVLTTIAVNSRTGPCNRNSIVCETQTPLDIILDDLVKREVVERDRSQYYSIRIGLFKEWLIAHQ